MVRIALLVAFLIAAVGVGPNVRSARAVGCDTAGAPTTTVYLPNITKTLGGPSGWVTPFIVQNVGAAATTLEVSFYRFSDGALVTCRKVVGLAPGTSFADVPNNDVDLPGDAQFAVVVRSFGSQVVSVVNEHQGAGSRAESLSYVGLSEGSTTVALPYIAKAVTGWLTTFVIQNLGPVGATVTVSLTSHDGTRTATLTRNIAPGRSAVVDPAVETGLVTGVEYGATLSSTQPIAVVVNAHNDAPSAPFPMGFSYNGIASSVGEVYLPWVGRNADGGRYSRIVVQNMGMTEATPVITFRQIGGSALAAVTAAAPVRPGRVYSFTVPAASDVTCPATGTPTCPAVGEHSVVVGGGLFAVLSSASNQTSALGVIGGAPATARSYLPNITRTLGGPAGWTTPVILQSAGATTATLRWYRFADGALVATQFVPSLGIGASVRIDPRAVTGLADDTQYGVIIDAPAPIRAIVLELSALGGDGAMAYEGFAASGTPSPAPVLTSLMIAPATAAVAVGTMQQFGATVRDQLGNPVSGVPITWSVTPATLGTIDAAGLFIAGNAPAAGTLTATFGSVSATTSLRTFSPTVTIGGLTFSARVTATSEVYTESTIATTDAQTIVASVDADLAAVQLSYGRTFARRPAVYAFATQSSYATGLVTVLGMTSAEAATRAGSDGVYSGSSQRVAIQWTSVRKEIPITTIRHELVHMVIQQIVGDRTGEIPAWLEEGSATLEEFGIARTEWRRLQSRYTAASMVATRTHLPIADLRDYEVWAARSSPLSFAQYFQASQLVQLLRDDVGKAGVTRMFDLVGGGQPFEAAFTTVTGRTVAAFEAAAPTLIQAISPFYPQIATATDEPGGIPGLSYIAYGFEPNASVTVDILGQSLGFRNTVRIRTVDAFGALFTYFGAAWPADTYRITVTGPAPALSTQPGALITVEVMVAKPETGATGSIAY